MNRDKTFHLHAAKRIAHLLDSAFAIPGTRHRVGLDAILGLLPVGGDIIGLLLSLYILYLARQMGMPKRYLVLMGFNIGVDMIIGAIPLIGDLADIGWKANLRNVRLMEQYVEKAGRETVVTYSSRRASSTVLPPGDMVIDVVPERRQSGTS